MVPYHSEEGLSTEKKYFSERCFFSHIHATRGADSMNFVMLSVNRTTPVFIMLSENRPIFFRRISVPYSGTDTGAAGGRPA